MAVPLHTPRPSMADDDNDANQNHNSSKISIKYYPKSTKYLRNNKAPKKKKSLSETLSASDDREEGSVPPEARLRAAIENHEDASELIHYDAEDERPESGDVEANRFTELSRQVKKHTSPRRRAPKNLAADDETSLPVRQRIYYYESATLVNAKPQNFMPRRGTRQRKKNTDDIQTQQRVQVEQLDEKETATGFEMARLAYESSVDKRPTRSSEKMASARDGQTGTPDGLPRNTVPKSRETLKPKEFPSNKRHIRIMDDLPRNTMPRSSDTADHTSEEQAHVRMMDDLPRNTMPKNAEMSETVPKKAMKQMSLERELPRNTMPKRSDAADHISEEQAHVRMMDDLPRNTMPRSSGTREEVSTEPIERFQPSKELPRNTMPRSSGTREEVSTEPIERFQPSKELPRNTMPRSSGTREEVSTEPIERFQPSKELPRNTMPRSSGTREEVSTEPIERSQPSKELPRNTMPRSSGTREEVSTEPIERFQPSKELPRNTMPKRSGTREEVSTEPIERFQPSKELPRNTMPRSSGTREEVSTEPIERFQPSKELPRNTMPKRSGTREEVSTEPIERFQPSKELPRNSMPKNSKTIDIPKKPIKHIKLLNELPRNYMPKSDRVPVNVPKPRIKHINLSEKLPINNMPSKQVGDQKIASKTDLTEHGNASAFADRKQLSISKQKLIENSHKESKHGLPKPSSLPKNDMPKKEDTISNVPGKQLTGAFVEPVRKASNKYTPVSPSEKENKYSTSIQTSNSNEHPKILKSKPSKTIKHKVDATRIVLEQTSTKLSTKRKVSRKAPRKEHLIRETVRAVPTVVSSKHKKHSRRRLRMRLRPRTSRSRRLRPVQDDLRRAIVNHARRQHLKRQMQAEAARHKQAQLLMQGNENKEPLQVKLDKKPPGHQHKHYLRKKKAPLEYQEIKVKGIDISQTETTRNRPNVDARRAELSDRKVERELPDLEIAPTGGKSPRRLLSPRTIKATNLSVPDPATVLVSKPSSAGKKKKVKSIGEPPTKEPPKTEPTSSVKKPYRLEEMETRRRDDNYTFDSVERRTQSIRPAAPVEVNDQNIKINNVVYNNVNKNYRLIPEPVDKEDAHESYFTTLRKHGFKKPFNFVNPYHFNQSDGKSESAALEQSSGDVSKASGPKPSVYPTKEVRKEIPGSMLNIGRQDKATEEPNTKRRIRADGETGNHRNRSKVPYRPSSDTTTDGSQRLDKQNPYEADRRKTLADLRGSEEKALPSSALQVVRRPYKDVSSGKKLIPLSRGETLSVRQTPRKDEPIIEITTEGTLGEPRVEIPTQPATRRAQDVVPRLVKKPPSHASEWRHEQEAASIWGEISMKQQTTSPLYLDEPARVATRQSVARTDGPSGRAGKSSASTSEPKGIVRRGGASGPSEPPEIQARLLHQSNKFPTLSVQIPTLGVQNRALVATIKVEYVKQDGTQPGGPEPDGDKRPKAGLTQKWVAAETDNKQLAVDVNTTVDNIGDTSKNTKLIRKPGKKETFKEKKCQKTFMLEVDRKGGPNVKPLKNDASNRKNEKQGTHINTRTKPFTVEFYSPSVEQLGQVHGPTGQSGETGVIREPRKNRNKNAELERTKDSTHEQNIGLKAEEISNPKIQDIFRILDTIVESVKALDSSRYGVKGTEVEHSTNKHRHKLEADENFKSNIKHPFKNLEEIEDPERMEDSKDGVKDSEDERYMDEKYYEMKAEEISESKISDPFRNLEEIEESERFEDSKDGVKDSEVERSTKDKNYELKDEFSRSKIEDPFKNLDEIEESERMEDSKEGVKDSEVERSIKDKNYELKDEFSRSKIEDPFKNLDEIEESDRMEDSKDGVKDSEVERSIKDKNYELIDEFSRSKIEDPFKNLDEIEESERMEESEDSVKDSEVERSIKDKNYELKDEFSPSKIEDPFRNMDEIEESERMEDSKEGVKDSEVEHSIKDKNYELKDEFSRSKFEDPFKNLDEIEESERMEDSKDGVKDSEVERSTKNKNNELKADEISKSKINDSFKNLEEMEISEKKGELKDGVKDLDVDPLEQRNESRYNELSQSKINDREVVESSSTVQETELKADKISKSKIEDPIKTLTKTAGSVILKDLKHGAKHTDVESTRKGQKNELKADKISKFKVPEPIKPITRPALSVSTRNAEKIGVNVDFPNTPIGQNNELDTEEISTPRVHDLIKNLVQLSESVNIEEPKHVVKDAKLIRTTDKRKLELKGGKTSTPKIKESLKNLSEIEESERLEDSKDGVKDSEFERSTKPTKEKNYELKDEFSKSKIEDPFKNLDEIEESERMEDSKDGVKDSEFERSTKPTKEKNYELKDEFSKSKIEDPFKNLDEIEESERMEDSKDGVKDSEVERSTKDKNYELKANEISKSKIEDPFKNLDEIEESERMEESKDGMKDSEVERSSKDKNYELKDEFSRSKIEDPFKNLDEIEESDRMEESKDGVKDSEVERSSKDKNYALKDQFSSSKIEDPFKNLDEIGESERMEDSKDGVKDSEIERSTKDKNYELKDEFSRSKIEDPFKNLDEIEESERMEDSKDGVKDSEIERSTKDKNYELKDEFSKSKIEDPFKNLDEIEESERMEDSKDGVKDSEVERSKKDKNYALKDEFSSSKIEDPFKNLDEIEESERMEESEDGVKDSEVEHSTKEKNFELKADEISKSKIGHPFNSLDKISSSVSMKDPKDVVQNPVLSMPSVEKSKKLKLNPKETQRENKVSMSTNVSKDDAEHQLSKQPTKAQNNDNSKYKIHEPIKQSDKSKNLGRMRMASPKTATQNPVTNMQLPKDRRKELKMKLQEIKHQHKLRMLASAERIKLSASRRPPNAGTTKRPASRRVTKEGDIQWWSEKKNKSREQSRTRITDLEQANISQAEPLRAEKQSVRETADKDKLYSKSRTVGESNRNDSTKQLSKKKTKTEALEVSQKVVPEIVKANIAKLEEELTNKTDASIKSTKESKKIDVPSDGSKPALTKADFQQQLKNDIIKVLKANSNQVGRSQKVLGGRENVKQDRIERAKSKPKLERPKHLSKKLSKHGRKKASKPHISESATSLKTIPVKTPNSDQSSVPSTSKPAVPPPHYFKPKQGMFSESGLESLNAYRPYKSNANTIQIPTKNMSVTDQVLKQGVNQFLNPPARPETASPHLHMSVPIHQQKAQSGAGGGSQCPARPCRPAAQPKAPPPPATAPPPSSGGGSWGPPPCKPKASPEGEKAVALETHAETKGETKPAEIDEFRKGEPPLTGLSKIFNSSTLAGRANVAKATFALMGIYVLYRMIKPKKKKADS